MKRGHEEICVPTMRGQQLSDLDAQYSKATPTEISDLFDQQELDNAIALSLASMPDRERTQWELTQFQEKRNYQLAMAQSTLIKTKEDMTNNLLNTRAPRSALGVFAMRDIIRTIFKHLPLIKDMVQFWRVFGHQSFLIKQDAYTVTYKYEFFVELAMEQAEFRYAVKPSARNPLRMYFPKVAPEPTIPPKKNDLVSPFIYLKRPSGVKVQPEPTAPSLPKKNALVSPLISLQPPSSGTKVHQGPSHVHWHDQASIEVQMRNEYCSTQDLTARGILSTHGTKLPTNGQQYALLWYDNPSDLTKVELQRHRAKEQVFLLQDMYVFYKMRRFFTNHLTLTTQFELFKALFDSSYLPPLLQRTKRERTCGLLTLEQATCAQDILTLYNFLQDATKEPRHLEIFQHYDVRLWRIHQCKRNRSCLAPLEEYCFMNNCALGGILILPKDIKLQTPRMFSLHAWGFELVAV